MYQKIIDRFLKMFEMDKKNNESYYLDKIKRRIINENNKYVLNILKEIEIIFKKFGIIKNIA
jgi:hypothetical protein